MAHEINPFGTLQHQDAQCMSCNNIIIFDDRDAYKQCGCPDALSYLCSDCFDIQVGTFSDDEFCECGESCNEYHLYETSPEKHPDENQNGFTYGYKNKSKTKMGLILNYVDIGLIEITKLKKKMQFIFNTNQIFKFNMIVNISNVVIKKIKCEWNTKFNLCIFNNNDILWVTADDPIIEIIFHNKNITEIIELYQKKSSEYQMLIKKILLSKYYIKCVSWFTYNESDLWCINYKINDIQIIDM